MVMKLNEETLFHKSATVTKDIDEVKKYIEQGINPNCILENEYKLRNVAQTLVDELSYVHGLNIVEYLVENGLDVNYRDIEGNTLIVYLLNRLRFFHFTGNGYEEGVSWLQNTFNIIMKQHPTLTYSIDKHVFDLAMKRKCLYFFDNQEGNMNEDDRLRLKDYRLARLLEPEGKKG